MTALSNLPSPDARQACVALGQSTAWPAEEWAIATRTLLASSVPMDEMGLERLIRIVLAVQKPPSEVAGTMVAAYHEQERVSL